jgi:hypothetical protein
MFRAPSRDQPGDDRQLSPASANRGAGRPSIVIRLIYRDSKASVSQLLIDKIVLA